MTTIIGALVCSQMPKIGFAFDKNKGDMPVWAAIFEAFSPMHQWVADKGPDVTAAVADPSQPVEALRSCRTTGPDPSRSASTMLPFVACGGRPQAVLHPAPESLAALPVRTAGFRAPI